MIRELRADVEGGLLLRQAMDRHPKVFSRLYVAMVEAGEAAGILDQVLDRVAFQIEKETKIKRRVKGAMIYPMMVLIFATLVLIGMLLFLVPIFVNIFATLGGQLPTLTQYVVKRPTSCKADWWFIFLVRSAARLRLPALAKKTERGRQLWDRFKLKLPMKIGDVVLKVTMARFSRTLSTLVAAGVDIIKALEITAQTAGNWVVEDALIEASARVHEGVPIAQPLLENPVFPPMVSQMIKVGEETGELEKMLGKIADFYEDEVDASIATLTLDHRAADDDRRRHDGRRDHHLDVPADVQDAHARQVGAADGGGARVRRRRPDAARAPGVRPTDMADTDTPAVGQSRFRASRRQRRDTCQGRNGHVGGQTPTCHFERGSRRRRSACREAELEGLPRLPDLGRGRAAGRDREPRGLTGDAGGPACGRRAEERGHPVSKRGRVLAVATDQQKRGDALAGVDVVAGDDRCCHPGGDRRRELWQEPADHLLVQGVAAVRRDAIREALRC